MSNGNDKYGPMTYVEVLSGACAGKRGFVLEPKDTDAPYIPVLIGTERQLYRTDELREAKPGLIPYEPPYEEYCDTLMRSLTHEQLLEMQSAAAREVMRRGQRDCEVSPPNGWDKLHLNKQTLKDMGRDERGAPLPPKESK